MNKFKPVLLLGFAISLLISCNQKGQNKGADAVHCVKIKSLPLKYAKRFTVDYYNGFKTITVRDWKDTAKILVRYVLVPKGKPAPLDFPDAVLIETPVQKVICISTTQIAELAVLNLADSIAGANNIPLIYNNSIVQKIKQEKIANLGNDEVNYEKLAELNPSFVITEGTYDGGDKLKLKLNSLQIKSVLDLDYKEQDPLARAEWLKFIAVFYDRESFADSIFNQIAENYLSLKEKVNNIKTKPTVFCNLPFKEIWYMPCGENYMARLINDAGGNFLWSDTKATNGLNLNLNYEAVYGNAANADYWLNTNFALSLDEIKSADRKNSFFKAYKTKNVYNNNKRNTPDGGFDFWESGIVNPDKILADLISIFHPELLPGHQLYYYKKLK